MVWPRRLVKLKGRFGLEEGDLQEIRILNRIVRIDEFGLRYEAHPRHSELMIKSLGMEGATSRVAPGEKRQE